MGVAPSGVECASATPPGWCPALCQDRRRCPRRRVHTSAISPSSCLALRQAGRRSHRPGVHTSAIPPLVSSATPGGASLIPARSGAAHERCLALDDYILTPTFPRLTGLLSFMLSDEMTTGSVTSTDGHKRAFAARSHAWNIANPRFKEAFPDVRPLLILPWHVIDTGPPRSTAPRRSATSRTWASASAVRPPSRRRNHNRS